MEHLVKEIAQAVERGLLPSTERLQRNAAGTLAIASFAVVCVVALFATVWFAIDERQGPVVASASIAGAALALALVTWAVVAILNRRAAERLELRRRLQAAQVQSPGTKIAALALGELPALVQASPVIAVLSVAGLTYAVMKSKRRP